MKDKFTDIKLTLKDIELIYRMRNLKKIGYCRPHDVLIIPYEIWRKHVIK